MTELDEASERWIERALAKAVPLSVEQLDLIRRTYGAVEIGDESED